MSIRYRTAVTTGVALLLGLTVAGCGRPAPSVRLTVEEYAIVERSTDQPTHFEFNDRIPPEVLQKRAEWRTPPAQGRDNLNAVNGALAPFGYRLTADGSLFRGESLLTDRLTEVRPVAVSANGKQFAFVAIRPGEGELLIRPGSIEPWDGPKHLFHEPIFVGNDLVEVEVSGDPPQTFRILRNGKQAYQGELGPWQVDIPLKGLVNWNGKWAAEIKGDLIVDGKSISHSSGFEEVFGARLIDGRPFYFWRHGGTYGLSFDGQNLANQYDQVIHYNCCEPAAFNPAGNARMVWFYARKGEVWHYVEAGVYE